MNQCLRWNAGNHLVNVLQRVPLKVRKLVNKVISNYLCLSRSYFTVHSTWQCCLQQWKRTYSLLTKCLPRHSNNGSGIVKIFAPKVLWQPTNQALLNWSITLKALCVSSAVVDAHAQPMESDTLTNIRRSWPTSADLVKYQYHGLSQQIQLLSSVALPTVRRVQRRLNSIKLLVLTFWLYTIMLSRKKTVATQLSDQLKQQERVSV